MANSSPQPLAPTSQTPTEYDRRHLALYAALLDADVTGLAWEDAAAQIMKIDPSAPEAEICWQSHLDRAVWIVGPGLAEAVETFGLTDA